MRGRVPQGSLGIHTCCPGNGHSSRVSHRSEKRAYGGTPWHDLLDGGKFRIFTGPLATVPTAPGRNGIERQMIPWSITMNMAISSLKEAHLHHVYCCTQSAPVRDRWLKNVRLGTPPLFQTGIPFPSRFLCILSTRIILNVRRVFQRNYEPSE
jgi:hypothetical protein